MLKNSILIKYIILFVLVLSIAGLYFWGVFASKNLNNAKKLDVRGDNSSTDANKYFDFSSKSSAGVNIKSKQSQQNQVVELNSINSFSDCAAAGFPVMEVSPRRCRTSDGRSFTEK